MRKVLVSVMFLLCVFHLSAQSGTVFGKWKTIDDETGEAKSIVEIYKKEGKVFGKIIEILNPADRDKVCIYCEGDELNAPIIGLNIIKNLKKEDKAYEGGTVFDPEKGKTYKAKIWVDEDNPMLLNLRGYVGFFYRTQQWVRVP